MIRLATIDDLPIILELAKEFHQKLPHRAVAFSDQKTISTIHEWLLSEREEKIILLAGEPVFAILAAMAERPFYSDDKVAVEVFWYSRKKSKWVLKIYEAYEFWANKIGCRMVFGGFLEEVEKYFKKRGYERVNTSYGKVL